jgi:TolB-like protein/Tfp pilus assembly protein PilF
VENQLDFAFSYQGEQTVINIVKPVRVYKVELDAEAAAPATSGEPSAELPLPNKPSIAVLPFANMSNDPEQEYFSDGMTDDIITDLSKISGLFVIARNSTFTYKGQAVKVAEVGRELGVRHVLEGSVRKAGNRVRINVQLIDALTVGHVWAERYDYELKDIFALQDAVTEQIVAALQVKLTPGEQERLARPPTDNVEAYDYFLRGWEAYWQMTQATNHRARQAFEQAITLDPTYAAAYAVLAQTYTAEWVLQWNADAQSLERAFELAQRAVALDDTLSTAYMALGEVYIWRRQLAEAVIEGERAVALDPNDADSYALLGGALNTAGQPEQALRAVEQAIRLNPRYPARYAFFLGNAHWLLRHREKAVAALQQAVRRNPDYLSPHLNLAALYGELGEEEAAHVEVAEILRINPHFTLAVWQERLPNLAFAERWQAGLRKAGLE